MTVERGDRLDPVVLAHDAAYLLSFNKPEKLVADLLKQVRGHDDTVNAVVDGYSRSYRELEASIEEMIATQRRQLANAVRREIDRDPAPNQRLSYAGGLRRAYRIVKG